jgi:hypothetical protein
MAIIQSFFEDRVFSNDLWASLSPDLGPLDFFLWAYLKKRLFLNKPHTNNTLKENITNEISQIDSMLRRHNIDNLQHHIQMHLPEDMV